MQTNTKKKIGVIALILILILCLYFVASTYANYASEISADSTLAVAQWAVTIGGEDATKESSFDLTLSTDNSEFVSENKIAPSTTASGTFEIDPTGSEVAMAYSIDIGDIEYDGTATGITFSIASVTVSYTDSSGATATPTDSYTTYADCDGVIGLADVEAGVIVNVTITVEWASTDNEIDTNYGIEAGNLTIPIEVTATQYLGN